MDYSAVKKILSSKQNIVITTHKSPDGDALGSSLALFYALYSNHNVSIIVPNNYPDYLKWMPYSDKILIYEELQVQCDKLIIDSDVIFCLDFNKPYRVDAMSSIIVNNDSYKIMIDHHEEPDLFCDQMLSDCTISSTAELVYSFLHNLGFILNKNIATCLYVGLVTDTGSFKFPNVTSQTHIIVSELMKYNINHSLIHQNLYDTQSETRLKLLKICLSNLNVYRNFNTALIYLENKDLISLNYKKGDTEGFVNIPLGLKGINFSAFFIEFKDGVKISFRSKGLFDVNIFAKKHFNGGGHKNAAGGFLKNRNMKKAVVYFKKVLLEHMSSR